MQTCSEEGHQSQACLCLNVCKIRSNKFSLPLAVWLNKKNIHKIMVLRFLVDTYLLINQSVFFFFSKYI